MPSEAEQATFEQPWKAWHGHLDPWSRQDVRDGAVYLLESDNQNHGTVAINKKDIDLSAPKEVPKR